MYIFIDTYKFDSNCSSNFLTIFSFQCSIDFANEPSKESSFTDIGTPNEVATITWLTNW